ncbi:SurA N-terminal domain-containing protein [Streptomyces sp. NPDC092296]|uniref:SurA N-terminal domain-containing protein n=1 Tax=Streptomyces sp. NPDC092296 TaxID=3366012 RepID=UPI00382A1E7C
MIRTSVPDRPAAPRRRRATAAAGVLLATVVLSACGAAPHPGAAAVVGDHRITTSAVQARVTSFRDAVADASKGAAQPENGGLARNTVREMVLADLVAQSLREHGLTVSDSEIQQAHAADAAQLGGEEGLKQALIQQKGIGPDGVDDFYRRMIGMQKLAAASGVDPNTEQGTEALRKTLADTAGKLKVELNPRYGTWDPKEISFGDGAEAWLHSPVKQDTVSS